MCTKIVQTFHVIEVFVITYFQPAASMATGKIYGRDNPIKISWSIKGYYHFRLGPPVAVYLPITRDVGNPYDPHAMLVKIPNVDATLVEVRHAQANNGIHFWEPS